MMIDYFKGGPLDGLEREGNAGQVSEYRQDGGSGAFYRLTVDADNARVWEHCAPTEAVALFIGAEESRAPVTMGDLRDLVLNADIHNVPADTPIQATMHRRKVIRLYVPVV